MGRVRAFALFGVPLLVLTAACTSLLGDFDVSDSVGGDGGNGDGSITGEGGNGEGGGGCTGTQTFCTDKCVETATDNSNCGTCGHACPSGFSCKDSVCDNGVVALLATGTTTCAALKNGSLYCWGANDEGQVGNGDQVSPKPPTFVAHDDKNNPLGVLAALGGSQKEICIAKPDGTPYCWGSTTFGQTTLDTSDDGGPLGIDAPTKASQTYQLFGTPTPQYFYTQMSVGPTATHQCGLEGDGGLYCWGDNYSDQLGHDDAGFLVDQECTKYGSPSPCTPLPYPTVTDFAGMTIKQVVTGSSHTCALDANGNVQCWGFGKQGQLGNGTQFGNGPNPIQVLGLDGGAKQIAAGQSSNCAVMKDATVYCWGYSTDGELGYKGGQDAGDGCCGVEGCFNNSCFAHYRPIQVQKIANATQVAVGYDHACALETDGSVWCWGGNESGQLGRGDNSTLDPTPAKVPGVTDAAGVVCGIGYTCAWLKDGTAKCWGLNDKGQLGNGNVNSPSPIAVVGLP